MNVSLPLLTLSKDIPIELEDRSTGDIIVREQEQTYRDDGGYLIQILTQVDFGAKKHKRNRKVATSLMRKLREHNFESVGDKSLESEVEISYKEATFLFDVIQKETLELRGTAMLDTVACFEEWYEELPEPVEPTKGE